MAINCPNCNTFLRGLEDIDVVDNRCKHCDFDELSIESMAAVMGANKKRYESDIDLDVSSPEIIDSHLTYEPDDEIVELIDDDPRKPMELPSQEIFNDIDKLNSYTRLPIWDVFSDLGLSGSEMRTICKEIEKEWKEDVLYYNEDANRGVLYAKILEPNIENWDINNKKLLIWTNIPSMNENPLETIGESGPWQWGLVEEEDDDDWRRAF